MTSHLHYTRTGSGPEVVLLHPVGLDQSFWGPVAEALAQHFSVIAVDLRGHGDSPQAIAGWTLSDYADDVARLLDGVGTTSAAVVGLSFGGMVAQLLAVRHPNLVARLVLCGCPSRFPDDARAAIAERGELAERAGMAAVVEATLSRWFSPDFLADGGGEAVRRRLLTDDVAAWATAWRAIAALNTEPALGTIRIPVLCVAGERDEAVPPAAVEKLAAAIRTSEYRVLPGATHMMHIQGPAQLAANILPFLLASADGPTPSSNNRSCV